MLVLGDPKMKIELWGGSVWVRSRSWLTVCQTLDKVPPEVSVSLSVVGVTVIPASYCYDED